MSISPPLALEFAIEQARADHEAGRYLAMEESLRDVVKRHPEHGRAWNLLGAALLAQHRNGEACEALAHSAQLLADDAQVLEHWGVALTRAGRIDEACSVLERACRIVAGAGAAREAALLDALGSAQIAAQRWPAAAAALRAALQCQPSLAKPRFNLGVCLLMQGQVDTAVAVLVQATALHPERAEGWALLSQARSQQEAWEAARAAAARAIGCAPQAHKSHFLLANAQRGLGNLDECATGVRQALTLLRAQLGPQPGGPVRPRNKMPMEPARQVLREVRDRLIGAGLPFFLCAGTLLGIVRDGDLLPNDKDMDLGLPWDVDRGRVLAAMNDGGFVRIAAATASADDDRLSMSLVHAGTGIALDLFFFRPDGEHFVVGFNQRPCAILSRPRRFQIGTVEWQGMAWPVPSPAAGYLADMYGENWRVPDSDFDTVLSSRCQTPESRPVRRCYGYLRLYERLASGDLKKAAGYCRQLLWQEDEPFIRELLAWLAPQQAVPA